MRKVCNFTDFFVIVNGSSDRNIRAIVDGIEEALEKKGVSVLYKEGYRQALWVVLDCRDVMIHIFDKSVREFYGLERLWSDASIIAIK